MAPAVILVARIAEKSIAIGALDTFDVDAAAESSMRELAVSGTLGAALVAILSRWPFSRAADSG